MSDMGIGEIVVILAIALAIFWDRGKTSEFSEAIRRFRDAREQVLRELEASRIPYRLPPEGEPRRRPGSLICEITTAILLVVTAVVLVEVSRHV